MATITHLRYVGQDAFRPGLPARDIDGDELAFIARQRKADVEDVVAEAINSGLYEGIADDGSTVSARNDDAGDGEQPSRAEQLRKATKKELLAIADSLNLADLPKRATNDQLVEAIEAEEARLAEEAAAAPAEASSSGEGDQGGTEAGDDPEASSSGESATPPDGGQG